ncbi:unnamed protein product [Clavelina lepadiformis]|uniref:Uncharacterized protein n=1 Tax=Clavelina lepadiformis TaxID=159417 RepID=A0ABP0EY64_CLALP
MAEGKFNTSFRYGIAMGLNPMLNWLKRAILMIADPAVPLEWLCGQRFRTARKFNEREIGPGRKTKDYNLSGCITDLSKGLCCNGAIKVIWETSTSWEGLLGSPRHIFHCRTRALCLDLTKHAVNTLNV